MILFILYFMLFTITFAGKHANYGNHSVKVVKTPKINYPEENYNQIRILNAHEANPHEAPYTVSLTRSLTGKHYCAGVIISSHLVLTAAHCVVNYLNIFVHAGLHDRNKLSNGQVIQISRKIVHKGYTGGYGEHDIALLVLSDGLLLDGKIVAAISLPKETKQFKNVNCTAYGWGHNVAPEVGSINLMKTNTVLLNYEDCKILLPPKAPLGETNICTSGRKGISVCNADSGSPLVIYRDSKPILVGVTSWVFSPCGDKGFPSVYACTISHANWIAQQMTS